MEVNGHLITYGKVTQTYRVVRAQRYYDDRGGFATQEAAAAYASALPRGRQPSSEAHRCQPYRNARGERIDPAEQSGIGCPTCCPPDGRVRKPKS